MTHQQDPLAGLGFLPRLRLGWRLLRDRRVSGWKWVIPGFALVVICSPQSLIPFLGQLDDLGVLALAAAVVAALVRWAPPTVVREHAAALNLVVWPEEPAGTQSAAGSAPPGAPIEAEYWIDDWR